MPAAEVDVDPDLVHRLLEAQHPDLAGRPIEMLANGWDNFICRLGADLVVRMPRRELGARLVLNEQRWLPLLAPRLPLAVPAPLRTGQPGEGYPWSWSITRFLPGEVAGRTPPANPEHAAVSMARFLAALHEPAPRDAPVNPVRGIPLADRDEITIQSMTILGDRIDQRVARSLWAAAKDTERWDGPPLWLHGDLHPANILVRDGALSAVIDFGDITSGDPATDLSVAWMLFPDPAHRDLLWDAYGKADDATKARAKGWALALSIVFQAHAADNPLITEIGRRIYRAVTVPTAPLRSAYGAVTTAPSRRRRRRDSGPVL
jgi:aminoglycoside phosphotransferase (APT) family kinase protein